MTYRGVMRMVVTSVPHARTVGQGVHKFTALVSFALRAGDLVVLVAAAILAYEYRFGLMSMPVAYQSTVARGVLFTLLVFGASSAYRSWRGMSLSLEAMRTAFLWLGVFVLGTGYIVLFKLEGATSRLWWGVWFLGTFAGSVAMRLVLRG